jgi:hypothetical protein
VLAASTAAGGATRPTPRPRAPEFALFEAPAELPSSSFAGEPSLGSNWRTGALLYQASASTYTITFNGSGRSAIARWSDVTPALSLVNDDPILATDPASGLTFAGGGELSCGAMAVTRDDGATWSTSVPCTGTPDHPTVGIGPGSGLLGSEGGHTVYYCQQYPLENECTASADEGLTWLPAVPVTGGCIGPSGHVKAGRDGTAYLPMRTCNSGNDVTGSSGALVGGAVSRDGGRSWPTYLIPGAPWPIRGFDPSVAITPDNTVYEAWGGAGSYHPLVAWSRDHGATWSKPLDLAATGGPRVAASAFHAVVAGANGRVAVAYLGTSDPGTAAVTPFDEAFQGHWYLYVSFTYDGGAHWVTTRALPRPVQVGGICDGGVQCLAGRNLLDFMDAAIDASGRVVVGFAQGCRGGCDPGRTTHAEDAWAAIARQTTGRGLLGDRDVSTKP